MFAHMHRKASVLVMLKFISPLWSLQSFSWPYQETTVKTRELDLAFEVHYYKLNASTILN